VCLQEMFRDIDASGDGKITREEFMCEMKKQDRK
jgi:Ca2+-binding EF-hand superfamily protein